MSKIDILNEEITRRQNASKALTDANKDINAAIEQFNKLDEMYRKDEKTSRERLESLYKEAQHFNGKHPSVYSFSQTEFYPFFQGQNDTDCNPYFPISKVKDKTFNGLDPLYAGPTKTGVYARDGNYGGTIEPTLRSTAMTALQAYPDISQESGSGFCTGETPPGSGTNETVCLANGGTWTPPSYNPSDTGTAKLRNALTPWKTGINALIADLSSDNYSSELSFWQNIITHIDTILAAVATDPTYPDHSQPFTVGSPEDISRTYLLNNSTSIANHVTDRNTYLVNQANIEEQLFFGIIKLRLHQANGSFAKLKTAKAQLSTNNSIISDNESAIRNLNLMKVKSS